MLKECKKNGILTKEVLGQIPGYKMDAVRKAKGPVVVMGCAEHIPCNPCETSCPQHAITIGDNITNLPSVDPEKCVGCLPRSGDLRHQRPLCTWPRQHHVCL